MRYFYERPKLYSRMYGETYLCNHPVYSSCTLYKIGREGLAVIQQRYNQTDKTTYWTEIDPWIVDKIYLHDNFKVFFDERSGECMDGLYPTVTVRQIIWGLKMKPLKRERWETCFDRRLI